MKNISIPIEEISSEGAADKCINLKRLSNAITTAPLYELRHNAPLYPLAKCTLQSGITATLFTDSLNEGLNAYNLFVADSDIITNIATINSQPLCAVASGFGWTLMTLSGAYNIELDNDDNWNVTQAAAVTQPCISFRTVTAGSISASVKAMTFTDIDATRSNPELNENAVKQLTENLIDAYRSICEQSVQSGCFFQPLFCRYELYSTSGEKLFTSEPQLIISPSKWQLTDSIDIIATRNGSEISTPPFTISAQSFHIEADIHSLGSFAASAAKLVVSLSPQIHPVNLSTSARHRIARPATDSSQITVTMPGITFSTKNAISTQASKLRNLLAHFDHITFSKSVLQISETPLIISNHSTANVEAEIASISQALSKSIASTQENQSASLLRSISAPDSFIARAVATSGDAVVWADITPIRSNLMLPYSSAIPLSETPEWSGTTMVTLADGSTALSPIGYPMPFPDALPAFVCIPTPEAVSIDIWADNIENGYTSHARLRLTTDSSRSRAFFLNEQFEETKLSAISNSSHPVAIPGKLSFGQRKSGAIASALIESPLVPLGSLCVATAPITSVLPAAKSQSSWEISRCHLYAFSPDGIFALTLSADRTHPYATLIDPRGVTDGLLTSYTSSGVMAVTSNRQLVAITASRVSTLLSSNVDCEAIAWHPSGNSLWMLTSESTIRILNLSQATSHYITLPHRPLSLRCMGATLIATSTHGFFDTDRGTNPERIISWRSRIPLPRASHPRLISIAMSASSFEGMVAVRFDSGAGIEQTLPWLKLSIAGDINSPLTARLTPLANTPYITITIDGIASPDFRLSSINLQ